ncbi:hypothetical protein [Roseivirga sp.]|uniref:hypothetical protein n=1 Tax=Roseivirga sp. TaxID=1964215 RepID=UPI003B51790B
MKTKFFIKTLVIVCLLSTTSCVSFWEKVFLKADGSGTYTFSVDMSNIIGMLAGTEEEMDTDNLLEELNMDEAGTKARLEAINGVSNVRPEFNKETNMLSMVFDFDNIDALNEGISTYLHDSTQTEVIQYEIYSMNGKSIERSGINLLMDTFQKSLQETSEEEGEELSEELLKMMFSDMYFATELQLEKKIKSFSNEEYEQEGEHKLVWKTYPFNELNNKTEIAVKVKVK